MVGGQGSKRLLRGCSHIKILSIAMLTSFFIMSLYITIADILACWKEARSEDSCSFT